MRLNIAVDKAAQDGRNVDSPGACSRHDIKIKCQSAGTAAAAADITFLSSALPLFSVVPIQIDLLLSCTKLA